MPGYTQHFTGDLTGNTQHADAGNDVSSNLASKLLILARTGNISLLQYKILHTQPSLMALIIQISSH